MKFGFKKKSLGNAFSKGGVDTVHVYKKSPRVESNSSGRENVSGFSDIGGGEYGLNALELVQQENFLMIQNSKSMQKEMVIEEFSERYK